MNKPPARYLFVTWSPRLKRAIWIAVALAVAAGIYFALRGSPAEVEMTVPEQRTVREYIAEDGKTRLRDEYTVDMPVAGTIQRIGLEVGDVVEKGSVIARVDAYELEQRVRELEAMIEQAKARVTGVDTSKPKPEDIRSAEVRVQEMRDSLGIARKNRAAVAATYEEARRAFARASQLRKDGVMSESQYEEAESRHREMRERFDQAALEEEAAQKALEQAEIAHSRLIASIDDNEYQRAAIDAEIEAIKAQLAVLHNDLKKTEICAPVSGPVLEKIVQDRRVLPPGSPLLRIGDLSTIEIECDVLSEEVTRVQIGNAVEITGKALQGKAVEGEVVRIYPAGFMKISALGVEQQRVRTIVAFDNAGLGLRPGTSVDLRIITAESKDTLAVPDRAVFRHEGRYCVFRVIGGKAALTPVELGLRNDDWAEVKSGLQPGEEIIAEPKNELEDGARVVRAKPPRSLSVS